MRSVTHGNSGWLFVGSMVVSFALLACDLQQMAVKSTGEILRKGSAALEQESDIELARQAAPASLKTVESFLVVQPSNPNLLYLITKGYCEYTLGFIENDLEEAEMRGDEATMANLQRRGSILYTRCFNYALRILGGKWSEVVTKDLQTFQAALKKAGKGKVPGLFFMGLALGGLIKLNLDNNYELLTHLPKVEAIFKRILELDPTFYNGGAHLALGNYYSVRGEAAGGDPKKGLAHFNAAIKIAGGRFLLHKVMLAKVYAVTMRNRALFEKLLKEVLRAKPDIWPEFRLANELAKHRARRYWTQRDELF